VKSEKEINDRVAEALEMVDLAGEQKKMPENLSGGMRKRVGLARTIVGRPACILYDEPTTGLDPIATDSINHLIRRLQKRLEVTSVVVTHDMKTAFHTADRIAFLHLGRIYFYGSSDELRASEDEVIQDFIHGRSEESIGGR
jgi:phospholipid/cholesterol/gamma-HCH transport system ATP-binding protein